MTENCYKMMKLLGVFPLARLSRRLSVFPWRWEFYISEFQDPRGGLFTFGAVLSYLGFSAITCLLAWAGFGVAYRWKSPILALAGLAPVECSTVQQFWLGSCVGWGRTSTLAVANGLAAAVGPKLAPPAKLGVYK